VGGRQDLAIVWHPPLRIDIAFRDNPLEELVGTRDMAARLAESAGLREVPAPPEQARWVSRFGRTEGDRHSSSSPERDNRGR
jgi:hypothetical protein